jgi:hypothetical protein
VRIAEIVAAVDPFPFVPAMRIEEKEHWGFPREERRARVRESPGRILCGPRDSSHARPDEAASVLKPPAPFTF